MHSGRPLDNPHAFLGEVARGARQAADRRVGHSLEVHRQLENAL
jgi:hypothetical protein